MRSHYPRESDINIYLPHILTSNDTAYSNQIINYHLHLCERL